jgi:hypothetical protein
MVNPQERKLKREIAKRGGQVSIKTIHPNPNNKSEFARVYVVRLKGPRGGKTIRGPIQRSGS